MGKVYVHRLPKDSTPEGGTPGVWVVLRCTPVEDQLRLDEIAVSYRADGAAALADANLSCASPGVTFPASLVEGEDFKSIEEIEQIADHAVRQKIRKARDELRQRLQTVQLDVQTEGRAFFGAAQIAGGGISAHLRLDVPALLDVGESSDAPILEAVATADIDVTNGDQQVASHVRLRVRIARRDIEDAVSGLLEVAADTLPDLDVRWPEFKLPNLSFDGIPPLANIELPRFRCRMPAGLIGIRWENDDPPRFRITIAGVDLTLATVATRTGELVLIDSSNTPPTESPVVRIRDFEASLSGRRCSINASFESADPVTLARDFELELGPFVVRVTDLRITPSATVEGSVLRQLKLTTAIQRVSVRARYDPAAAIAVTLTTTSTWTPGGDIRTQITELRVLEPSPVDLVTRILNVASGVVQWIAAIDLADPGVRSLVETLARLLGTVLEFAGEALSLLARGVAELLVGVLRKLTGVADAVLRHVSIELRFDANTYALRQIMISPAHDSDPPREPAYQFGGAAFSVKVPLIYRPSLVISLPEDGRATSVALVALVPVNQEGEIEIASDLWLHRQDGSVEAARDEDEKQGQRPGERVLTVKARCVARGVGWMPVALVALEGGGGAKFLRKIVTDVTRIDIVRQGPGAPLRTLSLGGIQRLEDFKIGNATDANVDIVVTASVQPDRALPFLSKGGAKQDPNQPTLKDRLSQYVRIKRTGGHRDSRGSRSSSSARQSTVSGQSVEIPFVVELVVGGFISGSPLELETQLALALDLRSFRVRLQGGKRIAIEGDGTGRPKSLLGMHLYLQKRVTNGNPQPAPTDRFKQFYLDFSDGDPRLQLAEEATATLSYSAVAREGRGLVFDIEEFCVTRNGLDLTAKITNAPVTLAGVDMPFRFNSGALTIRNGQLLNATVSGSGQLPPALVGEATAEVAISLARGGDGNLVVQAAQGALKPGAPLVCERTRFRFQIDELGFAFVEDGGYHFYFQLTGEARFQPKSGEFESGLLKNLSKTRIILRKVPLAGDGRTLLRHIEFQVPIDPPVSTNVFDIFRFQLKGVGFHPASPLFDANPAAMCISGQVAFTPAGDVPNAKIDFHQLWIAPPKSGESMPRFRFDGLGIEINLGASGKISGRALAVDDNTPSLYTGITKDSPVTARGFLAAGSLDISAWASMSASLGFLELRQKLPENREGPPRHSFFAYGQGEKLARQFSIFGYPVYLEEVGFGFGYRYTLAGISAADRVTTPQALVRVLDDVSRYQGNLNDFRAWQPEFDGDRLTLAMRAMISMTTASPPGSWEEEPEEALAANPLLFDVVAALRSDLTFLMTGRAWLCTTYWDWASASTTEAWKSNPLLRGYLYLSVPRKTLLARTLADGTGHIGDKPALFPQLKAALKATQWSSTLYIAPGIFHAEFGWPYDLRYSLGDEAGNFFMSLQGGLVLRIEDGAVLYGLAFRAKGHASIGGTVGGRSFGALAEAHADFALDAKFIAYVSVKSVNDTFFYGALKLDVTVGVRVKVWLEFKIFGGRIHFEVGFSFQLSLSFAVELCVQATSPVLGGRARVAVGVRAFGRTLSIGIGFGFNQGMLDNARARVDRFLSLGLGVNSPDPEKGLEVPVTPKPEPSRAERARSADRRVEERDRSLNQPREDAPNVDPTKPEEEQNHPIEPRPFGRPIRATNYWAMLFPTRVADAQAGQWYVMQLLPRDHTGQVHGLDDPNGDAGSFFAAPWSRDEEPPDPLNSPYDYELLFEDSAPDSKLLQLKIPERGQDDQDNGRGTQEELVPDHIGEGDGRKRRFRTKLNWDSIVVPPAAGQGAGRGVSLYGLLGEMFMGPHSLEGLAYSPYSEPSARLVASEATKLSGDNDKDADTLANASRTRDVLDKTGMVEAEVEERRSALLGTIAEGAAMVAAEGEIGGKKWASRIASVDPRDLGLTFVVAEEELTVLFNFDPESTPTNELLKATFNVGTRRSYSDWQGDVQHTIEKGEVHLFNPPTRMFRAAQPRLTAPTTRRTAQGIGLDWDLEPAWGESESVYDDPEFHLRHYRIERIVRNVDGIRPKLVTVKAAAPLEQKFESSGVARHSSAKFFKVYRPTFQFVDDLSDLSDDRKLALLGRETADRRTPSDQWSTAGFPEFVRLVYSIVPVDIAGTEADPTVVEHVVRRPLPERGPVGHCQLGVEYPQMPRASGTRPPSLPALRLTILDRDRTVDEVLGAALDRATITRGRATFDESVPRYQIRVLHDPDVPAGVFGADIVRDDDRIDPVPQALPRGLEPVDLDVVIDAAANGPDAVEIIFKRARATGGFDLLGTYGRICKADLHDKCSDTGAFRRELGVSLTTSQLDSMRPSRLMIRPIGIRSPVGLESRSGPWSAVDMVLSIGEIDSATGLPPVQVPVQRFEPPIGVNFQTLDFEDLDADAGRLYTVLPNPASSLSQLLGAEKATSNRRDSARRTGIRLRWNARPLTVRLNEERSPEPKALRTIVGGFDLFMLQPDSLPAKWLDSEGSPEDDALYYARHARWMARAELIPNSLRRLVPSETGPLHKVEAFYPSEAERTDPRHKLAAGRRVPWYSAAESFLVWPKPLARQQLLPLPDESDIAQLFVRGVPSAFRAQLVRRPIDTRSGDNWTLVEGLSPALDLLEGRSHPVNEVRNWLRELRFPWSDFPDPGYQFGVRIEVHGRSDEEGKFRTVLTIPVVFSSGLHPIMEELLADLRYEGPGNDAGADDITHRRYEPVVEPAPPIEAKTLPDFMDATMPDVDPYGWGVLRALGLAVCFRLYDTESGEFVRGKELVERIQKRLKEVIENYSALDAVGLGAPFVELMMRPEDLLQVASYDGGSPVPPENTELLENSLSFVQVSLRPVPSGMLSATNSPRFRGPVRYGKVRRPSGSTAPLNVVAKWGDISGVAGVLLDVVPVRKAMTTVGMQTLASRVSEDEAGERQAENWVTHFLEPGTEVPKSRTDIDIESGACVDEHDPVIALVRVLICASEDEADLQSALNKVEGFFKYEERGEEQRAEIDWEVSPLERCTPFEKFGDLDAIRGLGLFYGSFAPRVDQTLPIIKGQYAPREQLLRLCKLSERFGGRYDGATSELLDRAEKGEESAGSQLKEQRAAASQVAARLAQWSRRFFEHGPVRLPARDELSRSISFAFATVPQPDPWRPTVEDDGTVTVTLLEKDRWGHRRQFAIRPFGRYEAFEQAVQLAAHRPDAGATCEQCQQPRTPHILCPCDLRSAADPWVGVVVPRTEPVGTPVILSSRRVDQPDAADPTISRPGRKLELVIARPADEILADANTATDAAVSSHGMGVSLWREFAASSWTKRIAAISGKTIGAMPAIGSPEEVTAIPDPTIEADLEELRQWAPDLWRGAIAYRFEDLPYFYRTHALVYAAAGVVISGMSSATFAEGGYELKLPHHWDTEDGAPPSPSWRIKPDDGEPELRQLVFSIPLARFADCMFAESRRRWATVEPFEDSVFTVPDPAVSYRISLATWSHTDAVEKLDSLGAEIEIRPVDVEARQDAENSDAHLYRCDYVGPRFARTQASRLLNPANVSQRLDPDVDRPPSLRFYELAADIRESRNEPPPTPSLPVGQVVELAERLPSANGILSIILRIVDSVADFGSLHEDATRAAEEITSYLGGRNEPVLRPGIEAARLFQRAATIYTKAEFDTFAMEEGFSVTAKGQERIARKRLENWYFGFPQVSHNAASLTVARWDIAATLRTTRQSLDLTDAESIDMAQWQLAIRQWWFEGSRGPWQMARRPFAMPDEVKDGIKWDSETEIPGCFDVLWSVRCVRPRDDDALGRLFAAIDSLPASTDALRQLLAWEVAGWPTSDAGDVDLFVCAQRKQSITSAFAAAGIELRDGHIAPRLALLRWPPTTKELEGISEDSVRDLYQDLAREQLFGPGTTPVLQVFRGLAKPVFERFERE